MTSKMTRSTSMSRGMPGMPLMRMGGTTTVTRSSRTSRMGGFKIPGMMGTSTRRASPVFKMTGQKATLVNADQGEKYHPTSFPAVNALKDDNSFTHTKNKKGSWWKAEFKGGE